MHVVHPFFNGYPARTVTNFGVSLGLLYINLLRSLKLHCASG